MKVREFYDAVAREADTEVSRVLRVAGDKLKTLPYFELQSLLKHWLYQNDDV